MAIIEVLMVSPIFYSMAAIILAMLGFFMKSDKLSQRKNEPVETRAPQQKEYGGLFIKD
jgi:hypothetical protein